MKLILARHGETLNNIEKIMQGQTHGELSPLGKEQAYNLGKRLSKMGIDYIYCSDLERAKHTADEILRHVKSPIEYTADLRELNAGEYEGRTYSEYQKELLKSPDIMNYKPKGGESINEMNNRFSGFIKELEKKHTNQTILLVGHGGPIANFMLKILPDKEFEEVISPNCAISILTKENNGYKVELLNCTEHLC